MESKPPQNPPRKVENVDAQAMNLMKQLQERSMKAKPKAEKKVFYDMNSNLLIHKHCMILKMPLVFGAASTGLKSYGVPNGGDCKEYAEPWYYYSYYSVTLPLKRPYAGHPSILDVEEFGEAYDENSINPAADLGLMVSRNYDLNGSTPFSHLLRFGWQEEKIEPSMFFLQLPQIVPMIKGLATADDHEIKESSKPSVEKTCKLKELPAGQMGKMLMNREWCS
ncbi:hypothetical protein P3X46_019606 [Hevea brasiliensis]|uniref:Uncharacterized protein n=1 Tax=Hevea brasiliensis TaxID=3981 RepID=A0ABQ9LKJ9_HEVBR|nr:hypothetical protein P3X46_019606 [Hevea brasiliensis]